MIPERNIQDVVIAGWTRDEFLSDDENWNFTEALELAGKGCYVDSGEVYVEDVGRWAAQFETDRELAPLIGEGIPRRMPFIHHWRQSGTKLAGRRYPSLWASAANDYAAAAVARNPQHSGYEPFSILLPPGVPDAEIVKQFAAWLRLTTRAGRPEKVKRGRPSDVGAELRDLAVYRASSAGIPWQEASEHMGEFLRRFTLWRDEPNERQWKKFKARAYERITQRASAQRWSIRTEGELSLSRVP